MKRWDILLPLPIPVRNDRNTDRILSEEQGISPRRVTSAIQNALALLRVSLKDYIG